MPRDPATTHKIMSAIKSRDTEPELLLRKALWRAGLRYRLHVKGLPGKPDIVIKRHKLVVFCDGDFWHGHNWALRGVPSLDVELERYSPFWRDKITRNVERDRKNEIELAKLGWTVLRFWESDIRKDVATCVRVTLEAIAKAKEKPPKELTP